MEHIFHKILDGKRLDVSDCISLFENATLSRLGIFADKIKKRLHGNKVFFVRNYHIEPTNICVFQCKFCSFYATDSKKGWAKTKEEILDEVSHLANDIRELHIVGGSNPEYDLLFYADLLQSIKHIRPDIHIKAFTAAEIHYMATLAGVTTDYVLKHLASNGLDSIPGGGAEIFDDNVRKQICPTKINASQWLMIHRQAHEAGLRSNATMLYGHLESVKQRFEHMLMLRNLQDDTHGFQAFIPLKYKNKYNALSHITKETNIIEDLKMFAIARLFFDSVDHIKVYWPAYGKNFAGLALSFGADDLDGTIQNSTKIYSMAGANEHEQTLSIEEACQLIRDSGYEPIERDAFYRPV